MICVLQFDAASVAALERLLGEGRLPNLAALARARPPARARDAGGRLRRRRLLHALQRRRARRPRDLLSVPVVGGRAAGALRDRVRGAAGGLGATCRVRPADAGDRPLREPPAAAGGRASSSAAGASPTGSCCRAGRAPERPGARATRAASAAARRRPRSSAAPGARPARPAREAGRRPGPDRGARRGAARRASASTSPGSRSAPPTSPGTSSGTSRSSTRRRSTGDARATLEAALDDVYVAVDEAFGRVLAALPAGRRRDRHLGGRHGRQHEPRRPAAGDARPGARRRAARRATAPGAIWRLRAALPARRCGRAIADAIPDRAALALTARLELRGIDWRDDPRLRPPGRQPGLRAAQPPRARARRDRRPGRGRRAAGRDRRRARDLRATPTAHPRSTPSVRAPRALPGRARRPAARPRRPLVATGRRPRSPRCTRRASARSAATAAARGRSGNHTPGDAWALVVPGASAHAEPPRPPRLVDVAATVCEVHGRRPRGPARRAAADARARSGELGPRQRCRPASSTARRPPPPRSQPARRRTSPPTAGPSANPAAPARRRTPAAPRRRPGAAAR